MKAIVPTRLLFDFEFPLAHRATAPAIDGSLSGWTDAERLPLLGALDGGEDFADVWACWNEEGLFFACRIVGKRRPLRCNPAEFWRGDNVRLCTDMRDARSNKRATRTCQQFFLLPAGGGITGRDPVAGVNKFRQAREDAPPIDADRIRIASIIGNTGYALETHVPRDCLSGFDPDQHRRIGFYYIIEDRDLGQQYLTVGDEYQWFIDPSTWATAVLNK
jgi:hypothetical protein